MNKNQLKAVLKINGYTAEASDEDIRAVLLRAKYSEAEIQKALLILREKDVSPMIRSDGLHTVFYTDSHLRPSEIAGLLGIEVNFDVGKFKQQRKNQITVSPQEAFVVIGLSLLIAISSIVIYMYINNIGIFHTF